MSRLTYRNYINRLIEWTEDYLDYVAARIEFELLLTYGFSFDEAFQMVLSNRNLYYGELSGDNL